MLLRKHNYLLNLDSSAYYMFDFYLRLTDYNDGDEFMSFALTETFTTHRFM